MIRTLRRASVATVVLLAIVAGGPVRAHGPDPVLSDNLFAQDQRLEFRWRSGAEPPTAIKAAIKDAAADITASRGSRAATFGRPRTCSAGRPRRSSRPPSAGPSRGMA